MLDAVFSFVGFLVVVSISFSLGFLSGIMFYIFAKHQSG